MLWEGSVSLSFTFVKLQVTDGVHINTFLHHNPDALMKSFSLMISNGKLSKFARTVAFSGRLLAVNLLASECIAGYARVLENALNFPSDALLPGPISELQQGTWEWNLFGNEIDYTTGDMQDIDGQSSLENTSVVYALEEEFLGLAYSTNISDNGTWELAQDFPTQLDWDLLTEIENSEEYERLEMEEVCISGNCRTCVICPRPLCVTVIFLERQLTQNFFCTCSYLKEWRETLVYGMIYIVMPEKLKSLGLKRMRGMRENLREQASQYAFMRYTVDLGPGHSCTMVLCTVD